MHLKFIKKKFFYKFGSKIINNKTYVIASDGDLMEGTALETISHIKNFEQFVETLFAPDIIFLIQVSRPLPVLYEFGRSPEVKRFNCF